MNQLENFIGKQFKAIVKASYISFSQTEGKNVRDTQLSGQSASSIECILLMDKISFFKFNPSFGSSFYPRVQKL